jgi:hypothetical protein
MIDHGHVTVKKLSSGYFHLRGYGVCNWAQPKHWPCSEKELRASAFCEAGEEFILDCIALSETLRNHACGD